MLRAPCLLSLVVGATLGCTAVVDLDHLDGAQTGGAGGTTSTTGSGAVGPGGAGSQGVGGATSGYAQVVLADQPLGYWRLDERNGPTAASLVDTGPSGTYARGCIFGTAGAVDAGNNAAVQFDGFSCRIEFGNVFAFEGQALFSLEAWVKPGVPDSPLGRICSKEDEGAGKHQGYALLLDGSTVSFDRWLDDALDSANAASSLTQGIFSHVVATYDGTRLSVYINGQLSSSEDTTKALVNVSAPFVVGASSLSAQFFEGVLDEIAVYDTALSDERVVAHYSAGLTGL